MKRFIPRMYHKDVFSIPYEQLKEKGIRCLVFDLDNTLALIDQKKCPEEIKKLCKKLKKDFQVIIISNNNKKRIQPYLKVLEVDGVAWALKPFTKGLRQIRKKYHYKKEEMVMIGDQLVTDIASGNHFGILTILVDPLGKKDLKITGINRFIERRLWRKFEKQNIWKRGQYSE